jgi:hypothetical protein
MLVRKIAENATTMPAAMTPPINSNQIGGVDLE